MERDKKFFQNFIEKYPYPTYNEVMNIIQKDKDDYLFMFAEYCEPNHQWMKEIYENPLDKETVKKNGKMINERGGKQAMVWNYYTLVAVVDQHLLKSQLNRDDKIYIIYNFKDIISQYWNGIGEWQH